VVAPRPVATSVPVAMATPPEIVLIPEWQIEESKESQQAAARPRRRRIRRRNTRVASNAQAAPEAQGTSSFKPTVSKILVVFSTGIRSAQTEDEINEVISQLDSAKSTFDRDLQDENPAPMTNESYFAMEYGSMLNSLSNAASSRKIAIEGDASSGIPGYSETQQALVEPMLQQASFHAKIADNVMVGSQN